MYAPIFQVIAAVPAVTALLGTGPVRFWPFGEGEEDAPRPYAVWQTITGNAENYLDQVPDSDAYTLQVDVYADSAASVRDAARALRDAIEPHAHIVAWRGESREPDTKLYRYSFDVSWLVTR
ncbi:MAG TPA: hypothetical protein DEP32_13915 [Pseudomonas sp.]|nr:hypothetical protein [Pseudomonas sp.]MBB50256.1 hypothetical protein [Pseudomonadales bacterium]MBB50496.1 hypothetical protein [Pseudomonadales bacterium]HCA25256.1 hypothetical protein [Pseudomonas sp.]|tara:strand:+ start:22029 stop:22394 length:366 start_codon:yes stop_codon:yes gene_type:complete